MYSKTKTTALFGLDCILAVVEVDISNGLPCFNMVGSIGNEVREARERIQTALRNTGHPIPASRVTISLFPADRHKDSCGFDLPIAIGILKCQGAIPPVAEADTIFLGTLGLNGEIHPIKGILPMILFAARSGIKRCIIPYENGAEGAVVPNTEVLCAGHITEVIDFLRDSHSNPLTPAQNTCDKSDKICKSIEQLDFNQVKGQPLAKRAALISASGFHSLLLTGPPGVGKSMIAKRIPGIMPPMTIDESLELSSIYSICGKLGKDYNLITQRPFLAPHHSATTAALLGGGSPPIPGIISLAHRSVLFLDELPEFSRMNLDSLRQPLEEHSISIARNGYQYTYPANFLLVAAMNPCPCGYYPNRNICKCPETKIKSYMGRISGPILDRIDLCSELSPIEVSDIQTHQLSDDTQKMQEMVMQAREMQEKRYKNTSIHFNSELTTNDIEKYCYLQPDLQSYISDVYKKIGLSARSYHRMLRVSRTIADLSKSEEIQKEHIMEALFYRPNQQYWMQ